MTFRVPLPTTIVPFLSLALILGSGALLEGQARGKTALLNPDAANEQAPEKFRVNFETTAGRFVVEVHRAWAPLGADRFYNLVKRGFYDGNRFHRVTDLVAQFGFPGDPDVAKAWLGKNILDDPARMLSANSDEVNPKGKMAQSNRRGFVAFSQPGANRRSTQLMIHLVDSSTLDSQVTPFGQVVSGMNVVDKLYKDYGEPGPVGQGPIPSRIFADGNMYLEKEFPRLDYIKTATLVS